MLGRSQAAICWYIRHYAWTVNGIPLGEPHYAWTVASGLSLSCRLWPHGVVKFLWLFSSVYLGGIWSDRAIDKAACSLPVAIYWWSGQWGYRFLFVGEHHYAWTVACVLSLSCRLWPHGVVKFLWLFSSCILAAYGRTGPSIRPHAPFRVHYGAWMVAYIIPPFCMMVMGPRQRCCPFWQPPPYSLRSSVCGPKRQGGCCDSTITLRFTFIF